MLPLLHIHAALWEVHKIIEISCLRTLGASKPEIRTMAANLFYVFLTIGFLSTSFALPYLRKRVDLTHHQQSLILAVGFLLTLLVSFVAPPLMLHSTTFDKEVIVFWIAFSVVSGLSIYVLMRIFFWIKGLMRMG